MVFRCFFFKKLSQKEKWVVAKALGWLVQGFYPLLGNLPEDQSGRTRYAKSRWNSFESNKAYGDFWHTKQLKKKNMEGLWFGGWINYGLW